jgi:hypothetical protein
VVSGGIESGTTVDSAGIDTVVSGGTAVGARVASGRLELVESDGIDSTATIKWRAGAQRAGLTYRADLLARLFRGL